jgi:hypothetical protein
VNYNFSNILNIIQLNKNLINIHQLPELLFDIGVKIAVPYDSKGSPDRPFRDNQYSKVILCSDRNGNSEEIPRETKYELKID